MILIYLAPVPWHSIAQRPHFFVKSMLDSGDVDKVYWIDPIPSRFPRISDLRRLFQRIEPDSFPKPENLIVVNPGVFIPIEPLSKLFRVINYSSFEILLRKIKEIIDFYLEDSIVLVVGKPSQLALTALDRFSFNITIADIMDDFPCFFTGMAQTSMRQMMIQLISKVQCTWFSSHNLKNKYSSLTNSYKVILNASSSLLVKHKRLNSPEKVIYGYIGSINSWFDWSFINKLAEAQPDREIWIVGPRYVTLPLLAGNIKVLPAVDHDKIGEYLACFSYGIIPFKKNELTESVDPVKYYEYIAYGLPVISTSFGEMSIRIKQGFACSLEQHLQGIKCQQEVETTWEHRFTREALSYGIIYNSRRS
ncbi:hypothetical protein ACLSZ5_10600, partial [Avibacterium avium]